MTILTPPARRLIVAVSGASGACYGLRLLQELRKIPGLETHLVVSDAGRLNLQHELDIGIEAFEALADVVHDAHDIGASIASGSFQSCGMVIAPCSMRTLAAVAHGLSDNLITRAADVIIKERRRLILLAREAPLNLAHLRNMTSVTEMGGIIYPPVPSFYFKPKTVDEIINHTISRIIDLLDIPQSDTVRWNGLANNHFL